MPAADRDTPRGRRELKITGMMLVEPNIDVKALEAITAPALGEDSRTLGALKVRNMLSCNYLLRSFSG